MAHHSLQKQIRETIDLLEFSGPTPVHWEEGNNILLFTKNDLEAFAKSWKFRVDIHDPLGFVAIVWDTMLDKLTMAGIPRDGFKPRSRNLPIPYIFGILFMDPSNIEKAMQVLGLTDN